MTYTEVNTMSYLQSEKLKEPLNFRAEKTITNN